MIDAPVPSGREPSCGGGATVTKGGAPHVESPPVSRASLIETYISALPFAPVAVVATPGGCRIEVGGTSAPTFYFKLTHIELVLGAAGLSCGPVDQAPDAVAALIRRTAIAMHVPFETSGEIRAAAEQQVAEVVAKVQAMRWNGEMKEINAKYKAYRLAQVAMGKKAKPYSAYLAHFTAGLVRDVAATGRMI